ncbi:MAG: hypothetical protein U0Q03_11380 [Acidimicrobiales bacterium]
MATESNTSLHELSSEQALAVAALFSGATHAEAAEAAGVHRVTVSKWASHHPAFVSALATLRRDAAFEARDAALRTTRAALDVVFRAIDAGDVDAAFKWLRLGSGAALVTLPIGALTSHEIVEEVRRTLPDALSQMLASSGPTAEAAEAAIRSRLAE